MPVTRIKNLFRKDGFQRAIYALGLVAWTYLLRDVIFLPPSVKSSIGLSYSALYLISSLILVFQILFNNRILWTLIFGAMTSYILYTIYVVVSDVIERSGNYHIKAIGWRNTNYLILIAFYSIMITIDLIIFSIKPRRTS